MFLSPTFFILGLAILLANGNLMDDDPIPQNWNEFLFAPNIFPASINSQVTLTASKSIGVNVTAELKILLGDPQLSSEIYSNYLKTFEKDSSRQNQGIFINRLFGISKHNLRYVNGLETWAKGVNQFTDLTFAELESLNGDAIVDQNNDNSYAGHAALKIYNASEMGHLGQAPPFLDYRDQVNTPKNQWNCPSCWAFATTGVLEAAYYRAYGQRVDLSPQQLVDCMPESNGCKTGSLPLKAMDYLISSGIASESDYPYNSPERAGSCNRNVQVAAKLSKWYYNSGNEESWKNSIYKNGPAIVSFNPPEDSREYARGVFTGTCGEDKDRHVVVIVGYGRDNNRGLDFWLVKNSYGTQWGDRGFFRIQRGVKKCDLGKYNYGIVWGTV